MKKIIILTLMTLVASVTYAQIATSTLVDSIINAGVANTQAQLNKLTYYGTNGTTVTNLVNTNTTNLLTQVNTLDYSVPPSIIYNVSNVTSTVGTAININRPANTGGSGVYTIWPSLPAGLSIDSTTGAITGTPTSAQVVGTYTVMATNAGGKGYFAINIAVNAPVSIYKTSKAVTYSGLNNQTISGLSFDEQNDSVTCINLFGCNNIHITKCRFANTKAFAVYAYGCTNVTIDSCFVTNVACGFIGFTGKTYKFNNNQFLNINGNNAWVGHAIQWNSVSASGGNQANYNIIVNQQGIALNPHDMISPYNVSGLPGDSLQIIGNIIVGGQINYKPGMTSSQDGAAAITLCDVTGNYQVARYNTIINGAGCGIQTVGTGTGLKADHNIVYIKLPTVSTITTPLGISVQNPSQGNYFGYNRVLVYRPNGTTTQSKDGEPAYWNSSNTPTPAGWNTNKWQDVTINPATLVPTTLITYQ